MRRATSFVALSRVVWTIIVLLGAAGVFVQLWPDLLDDPIRDPIVGWFDLGREGNVATWLSALLLGTSGLLALLNGGRGSLDPGDRRYWHWLGYILLFLSLDEAVAFHEQVDVWMGDTVFGIDTRLGWVLPWAVFAVLIGAVYWRFLSRQDHWLRRRIIGAGTIYVMAALVVRLLTDLFSDELGDTGYQLAIVTQEVAEMAAIAWFAITVLRWTTEGPPDI